MYFLDGCPAGMGPILGVINFVVNGIMILVPIALIIIGMIDLGKAVISSKEDEIKKSLKAFGKRFIYAVGVFAVVGIVTYVFSTIKTTTNGEIDPDQGNWLSCWQEIRSK